MKILQRFLQRAIGAKTCVCISGIHVWGAAAPMRRYTVEGVMSKEACVHPYVL